MIRDTNFSAQAIFRGALVFLMGVGFWIPGQTGIDSSPARVQTGDIPAFEERNCQEIFPKDWWNNVDLDRFYCGYLVTWEDYNTQSDTIELAVLETYPTTSPRPAPVVWLAGGPGSSGYQYRPKEAITFTNDFGRGLIQFSQRGSYLSGSELLCDGYHDAIVRNWETPLGWKEWNSIRTKALKECLARLQDEESLYDLSTINSRTNAMDVIYLIRALQYGNGNVNLYGGSYGTLLAQHVLALSPGDIRSAVLDGVAPLGRDWEAENPLHFQRSLQKIFDACALDTDCQEAYPDLERVFYELLDQLKDEPAVLSVVSGDRTYSNVHMDHYGFLLMLNFMMYHRENIKKIPRIIYAGSRGELGSVPDVGHYYFEYPRKPGWPWVMYYSIYCSEFSRFDPGGTGLEQLKPEFQPLYDASKHLINEICTDYDPQGMSYGDARITNSSAPVLIFNGGFDPVTPPEYGAELLNDLSIPPNAYMFTSWAGAHGNSFGKCAKRVMKNFFDQPDRSPDLESCWEEEPLFVEFEMPNPLTTLWQNVQQGIRNTWNTWVENVEGWGQEQQKNITEAAEKWWQEQQERLKNEFDRWWQDFQQQLADQLEQLFLEWLNQCLPSALLPIGVMAGVRISRRRRKARND